jgi:CRP/FNR family transcriptional regulator
VKFLSALDSDELATVASSLTISRYQKGEAVFDSLERVRQVHILLCGAVKVSRVNPDTGKELILYIVAPGEPFGVIPFFDEKDSDLIATALRASRVGKIDREALEPLLADRGVEDAFLQLVASRGRRLEERLYELAFHDVSRRLALLLVQLSEQFPKERECGREIGIWLSQQDLASFIAATREMASLTINDFKRKGWIAAHGRKICLHDVDALQEFISREP